MDERRIQCLGQSCEFEGENEDELIRRIEEHEREEHDRTPTDDELRDRLEPKSA